MTASKKKIAVLVAPYSPEHEAEHLGAAKKIQLVASLLHRLGYALHYVDSAHPTVGAADPVEGAPALLGDTPVTLWRPACLPSRKVGKLFNIYGSQRLFHALADLQPALVWVYNAYAFEAKLGLFLRSRVRCSLVLELEDLPTARPRGLNPKPLLDLYYFRKLLPVADLVTFVNAALMRQYAGQVKASELLPSVLQDALVQMPDRERFSGAEHRLGYFGGLEVDKGVSVLLELPALMPEGWKLVVTGVGSLSAQMRDVQKRYPDVLEFHGAVPHGRVLELMQTCDAIVNPHEPIADMGNGVFPFKVCEALASGALLITTPLPSIDLELAERVELFDGSVGELAQALVRAPARYRKHRDELRQLRESVCQMYGEKSVCERFRTSLEAL